MHEHLSSSSFDCRKDTASAFRHLRSCAVSRLRKRIFRSAYLAIFVASIAAACCFHSRFVQADQPVVSQANSAPSATASLPVEDASALPSTSSSIVPVAILKPVPTAPKVSTADQIYQIDEKRENTVPFKKTIHLSQSEPVGQARVSKSGSDGLLEQVYRVTYKGSDPIKFELRSSKVVKAPVDSVILAGYTDREARALPSRSGNYTRMQEIDMIATGYSPYEGSGEGRCANGMRAGFGVVAVDPRIIPLGSKLYIDGYGYALAGDTGGAIKGRRIDLGLNTYRAANDIGRRPVHVYVLSEGR